MPTPKNLKKDKAYRRYNHDVEIISAEVNSNNQNKGKIRAKVKEKSDYFRNNKLLSGESYEDNLVVDYFLTKQANKWLIEEIKVVN